MVAYKDCWNAIEKLIRLLLGGLKENKINDCKTMEEYYNNHKEYRLCMKKNTGVLIKKGI